MRGNVEKGEKKRSNRKRDGREVEKRNIGEQGKVLEERSEVYSKLCKDFL